MQEIKNLEQEPKAKNYTSKPNAKASEILRGISVVLNQMPSIMHKLSQNLKDFNKGIEAMQKAVNGKTLRTFLDTDNSEKIDNFKDYQTF